MVSFTSLNSSPLLLENSIPSDNVHGFLTSSVNIEQTFDKHDKQLTKSNHFQHFDWFASNVPFQN